MLDKILQFIARKIKMLPMENGGTGRDLTDAPPNSIIRMQGTGYKNLYYIPSENGALYSTYTDDYPKFGILPVAQGGTGATTVSDVLKNLKIGGVINGKHANGEIYNYYDIGDLRICWGFDKITPLGDQPETKTITFPKPFAIEPSVFITLKGSPEADRTYVTPKSATTKNFVAHAYSSTATTRPFYWIAIGKK